MRNKRKVNDFILQHLPLINSLLESTIRSTVHIFLYIPNARLYVFTQVKQCFRCVQHCEPQNLSIVNTCVARSQMQPNEVSDKRLVALPACNSTTCRQISAQSSVQRAYTYCPLAQRGFYRPKHYSHISRSRALVLSLFKSSFLCQLFFFHFLVSTSLSSHYIGLSVFGQSFYLVNPAI